MIERRTLLGILAGAAVVADWPRTGEAAARQRTPETLFDPANPEHVALAFRKLAWSMDGSLTFQWLHGTRYGIQGSLLTPFWEMHVGTWFRTRDLVDGRYEVNSAGANFYTLPGQTALLEKFLNPYTAETVEIVYGAPRVTTTVYDRTGASEDKAVSGTMTSRKADVGPAWLQGDELTVRGDVSMHNEPTETGRRSFTVQDMSTWMGSVVDVMNPRAPNPPSRQMFNDVLDYPAYLRMREQPGTYFSRCHGGKAYRYEDMPATWRALFAQKVPDVARDPGGFLDRRT